MGALKITNEDLKKPTVSFNFTRCFTKIKDRIFVEAGAVNAYALVEGLGIVNDPYGKLFVLVRVDGDKDSQDKLTLKGGISTSINDEFILFVFNVEKHKEEVQKILEGRFTELSKESKETILLGLAEWLHEGGQRRRANMWKYLHPLYKDKEELADKLGVPKSLIKEIRERPKIELETLRIGST